MFFLSRISKPPDEVKNEIIPQSFIGWGDSSLIYLISQMVRILVTPFIDSIFFDIAKGQSGPLHWHPEILVSQVQHAHNSKFVLEFVSFGLVSIEVIYMAIYPPCQIMAFIIPIDVVSIVIVVIVPTRWSIRWISWWSIQWISWWSIRWISWWSIWWIS